MPRSAILNKESITTVNLYVFCYANIVASCTVVYAVVHQPSVTNQELVVSKSRISKKRLTIPRSLSTHGLKFNRKCKSCIESCNIRSITM